jgi:hypothetical protein
VSCDVTSTTPPATAVAAALAVVARAGQIAEGIQASATTAARRAGQRR